MARYILIIAAFSSMIITALSGFFILPWLKKLHYGQIIKDIGPTWHNSKQGTPMMGGLMFIIGSVVSVALAYAGLMLGASGDVAIGNSATLMLITSIVTTAAFSLVGFIDDYLKVVHKQNLGLKARYKVIMQVAITSLYLTSLYMQGVLSTSIDRKSVV